MNKFLICMDTHIKDSNVDLIEILFDQIIEVCKKNNIKTILHGGDIFNSRTAQSLNVLRCFNNILNKLQDNGLNLWAIPGNHDKANLEDTFSFLNVFGSHSSFQLLEREHSVEELSDRMIFHFLPYFKENGSYLERLSNIKVDSKKKNVLITHIAVSGVKNNDGSVVNNNVKSELFKQFDKVYVAHYHNKQKVSDNIEYLGSLYPANYGEDNQKGIHIVDEDMNLEFIKLDFPEYYHYKFKTSDIKDIRRKLKEIDQKHNIRFTIKGNEEEIENFNKKIFDDYLIEVRYEKEYSDKNVELKKYKIEDIYSSFEEFCKDKSVSNNIKAKTIKYLKKVL